MSNTAVINIKTDPVIKKKAQKIAKELGFSLSSIINAYLRQLTKTKSISFSTSSEEPSDYLIRALKESDDDIKAGRIYSFDEVSDSLDFLDEAVESHGKNRKN